MDTNNNFQSWPFCTAVFKTDRIPSRIASIEKKNQIIGVVIIQEIKLGFITSIQIQRGPLWRHGQNTITHFSDFCAQLNMLYPRAEGEISQSTQKI